MTSINAPGGRSPRRVLDPIDRVSEVLFGLIMVLTFTGSLSVAEAGREDVRAMLTGALGCNLAWAVIDSILYLMGSSAEKGSRLATLRAIRGSDDPRQAQQLIADALPTYVAAVVEPPELETLRVRLRALPEPPPRAPLVSADWLGAAAVFLLVVLSTFPVAIPFIVMGDARPALRLSNAIAVAMLFAAGFAYGRLNGRRPIWSGLAMVLLGAGLVGLTIALGG
jgi:VIT1/CCC1 family predicted Fe2+/Mn2+ transporter